MEGNEDRAVINIDDKEHLFTIVVACPRETALNLHQAIVTISPALRYSGVSHTREDWMRVWDAHLNPDIPVIHNYDLWMNYTDVPDAGSIIRSYGISQYQIVQRDTMLDYQALTRLSIDIPEQAPDFDFFDTIMSADDSMEALLNSINWDEEFEYNLLKETEQ
jgi:hypothetical protein